MKIITTNDIKDEVLYEIAAETYYCNYMSEHEHYKLNKENCIEDVKDRLNEFKVNIRDFGRVDLFLNFSFDIDEIMNVAVFGLPEIYEIESVTYHYNVIWFIDKLQKQRNSWHDN